MSNAQTHTEQTHRPHILLMNRSFWPDTEATGQLLTELSVDLTAWFDVTVIAGTANHVDHGVDNRFSKVNDYCGVQIIRAWHTRFSKRSSLGRLINLTTFAISAWLTARFLTRKPDAIVVETDPFFLPLVGSLLRRQFSNASLVCYLQDIYPDIAVSVGVIREGIVTRTLRDLLFRVYRCADRVVVLSRDMRNNCLSLGVPETSLKVVPNWADTSAIRPVKENNAFRRDQKLDDRFVVMYSGNMGLAHELDSLADAAAILRNRSDIEWVFIGDGVRRKSLEARFKQLQLTQVRFLPYQPKNLLSQSLSAADVHIVSIKQGALACVMPSKLYGILAAGTALIAVSESASELSDLIRENDVGLTCEPGNAKQLAEMIVELADAPDRLRRMGHNARALAESSFSREQQTARFGEILGESIGYPLSRPTQPTILTDIEACSNSKSSEICIDNLDARDFQEVCPSHD